MTAMTDTQQAATLERTTACLLGFLKRVDSARGFALEQEIAGMSVDERFDRVTQALAAVRPTEPKPPPPVGTLCAEDRKLFDKARKAIDGFDETWKRFQSQGAKKT
jgi:hypothetical protein